MLLRLFISTSIKLNIIKKIMPTTRLILTIILELLRIILVCTSADTYLSPTGGYLLVLRHQGTILTENALENGASIVEKMQDVSRRSPEFLPEKRIASLPAEWRNSQVPPKTIRRSRSG
jgi:hypothetical protein